MTTFKIQFEPAYVLHARPYRDTSCIVNFFTRDYGVVGAVARGVRQKKSRLRGLINPFVPLLVTLQGRGALKTMAAAEANGPAHSLTEQRLYSGLYLNELLQRLLPEWDAHSGLFGSYQWALQALSEQADLEVVLRQFENSLLRELGVAISWECEAQSDTPIDANAHYRLDTEAGFVRVHGDAGQSINGWHIVQAAQGQWRDIDTKRLAKRVNRTLLQPLLGTKPLNARRFFK